jgi:hypothetical protein
MLLTIHCDGDFINVEGIAIATVLSLQPPREDSSEFDAPEADSFATDCDASFGKQIFDISVTEIETVLEPDSVADEIRWESMTLVGIHYRTIPFPVLNLSVP